MKRQSTYQILMLTAVLCLILPSCKEYPDAYEPTKGSPEVLYVRLPDAAKADSLLDGAFLGNTICLVGNNLRSIKELYFNDRQAVLNTGFITDHTLIVTVPKDIPEKVTNKVYMTTTSGATVEYPFFTKVPAPVVNSISCEYASDGDEATLYGDFFIDDPNTPLQIKMAGNIPVTRIISIEKTQVRFEIPANSESGFINVTSLYGNGRSHFQFRDDRGIILDWDNLDAAGGWRAGKTSDVDGISGKYVVFKGTIATQDDWLEDDFSFNLWGESNGRPQGDLFDAGDLSKMVFKFEVNARSPWTALAMQIIFTPWELKDGNGYYSEPINRALWIPWATKGSYKTDGWETVSIPMTNFKYTATGGNADMRGAGNYGGLSMFIWNGGVQGSFPCSPELWIDNIRVVPIE
ncbi:MAG: glycan-binding surface protein [Bacteroidales bacterium]|jgi:hypothetical protein|nr:glycan-binding surface protein [Bacteroidales bacterium]